MTWVEAEGHPYFGDCYIADLGAYTGPWPPTAPAIKMGSSLDTLSGLVVELDVAVGIPNGSADPLVAFDGSYATDLYDAYRYLTRDTLTSALLGGSQVANYTDSPGGGPGDFSAAPAGAHLFVVWYPGVDVTFGIGWTPGIEPEAVAPTGFSASATGPNDPDPATGAWSGDRTGDIEPLAPVDQPQYYYEQNYNGLFALGWSTGDADVAAEAVTALDGVRADGLSSSLSAEDVNCWSSILTYKGNQFVNGDGSDDSRIEIVEIIQASWGFDFSNIDTFTLPSYPQHLLTLHENLDYTLPPSPFGSGTDAGSVNYNDPAATHSGFSDFTIYPSIHSRWTSVTASDTLGSGGQGHALSSDISDLSIRVSFLEGTLRVLPAVDGTAQRWQNWDEGTVLQTIPGPDLSVAMANHELHVLHSTGGVTDAGGVIPCDSFVDINYDDGIAISLSSIPLSSRVFALNFKPAMQDPGYAPPIADYTMPSAGDTDKQLLEQNFRPVGAVVGGISPTTPVAHMTLPIYRYWSFEGTGGGSPPPVRTVLHAPTLVSTVYPPPEQIVTSIVAPTTRVFGRIEIYEQDGITRWAYDKVNRFIDGSVSVDYNRDERRTVELVLDNSDEILKNSPGFFWYDKIIKVFKQVRLRTAEFGAWEYQVGEFMIDKISEDNFPFHTKVSGRDYTKRCLNSKFVVPTTFTGPNVLETLIGALAANSGITKMLLPTTGVTVEKDFTYERNVPRWQAMKEIATAYSYDIFFDHEGYLRLVPFADPATETPIFTFLTGSKGNLETYTKSTDDSQLYNHVLVVGGASGPNSLPCWAEAKNEVVGSPTSIDEIGDRLLEYDSTFILQRYNLASDSNAEYSATDQWTDEGNGIAGDRTITKTTSTPYSGSQSVRMTWDVDQGSAAASDGQGMVNIMGHPLFYTPVVAGEKVSATVWVRSNRAQRVAMMCTWVKSGGAVISNTYSSTTDLIPGEWTPLKFVGHVAPADTDHIRIGAVARTASGGVEWTAGSHLDMDNLLVEKASAPGEYFDGDMYACWWTDTPYVSTSVSNQQAQNVADTLLLVHQLEQFDLDMTSVNLFFLEVGTVVAWLDPRPSPGDPTSFFLQSLGIPIGLGIMSATAARIINVGGT